jgi:hypothetical protein
VFDAHIAVDVGLHIQVCSAAAAAAGIHAQAIRSAQSVACKKIDLRDDYK